MPSVVARRYIVGWLGLALTLGACSSATVQRAPEDAGIARSFNAPFGAVKQAAIDALQAMQIPPSETKDEPTQFVLLVSRPPHGMSWGEVGRVIIEKNATPPIVVRSVYDKRFPIQFAGSQSVFARNLYLRMDKILGTTASN